MHFKNPPPTLPRPDCVPKSQKGTNNKTDVNIEINDNRGLKPISSGTPMPNISLPKFSTVFCKDCIYYEFDDFGLKPMKNKYEKIRHICGRKINVDINYVIGEIKKYPVFCEDENTDGKCELFKLLDKGEKE